MLVLGWLFNVSGDRCLSNVLCWFCVVLFSCVVFVCLSNNVCECVAVLFNVVVIVCLSKVLCWCCVVLSLLLCLFV